MGADRVLRPENHSVDHFEMLTLAVSNNSCKFLKSTVPCAGEGDVSFPQSGQSQENPFSLHRLHGLSSSHFSLLLAHAAHA